MLTEKRCRIKHEPSNHLLVFQFSGYLILDLLTPKATNTACPDQNTKHEQSKNNMEKNCTSLQHQLKRRGENNDNQFSRNI